MKSGPEPDGDRIPIILLEAKTPLELGNWPLVNTSLIDAMHLYCLGFGQLKVTEMWGMGLIGDQYAYVLKVTFAAKTFQCTPVLWMPNFASSEASFLHFMRAVYRV